MKEQGYTPKLRVLEELEERISSQAIIAIKKIFELPIETPGLSTIQQMQSNAYTQDKDKELEL